MLGLRGSEAAKSRNCKLEVRNLPFCNLRNHWLLASENPVRPHMSDPRRRFSDLCRVVSLEKTWP
eukprot:4557004-Alexandrium_andersonii.AAC.1